MITERPDACGKCGASVDTDDPRLITFTCKSVCYFLRGTWKFVYVCGRKRR